MKQDSIAELEIDASGRLYVVPTDREFPHIYREAMEVHWDPVRRALYAPAPRVWSYARWFQQILDAAREQGCELQLAPSTEWSNIDACTKAEFLQIASNGA